MNKIVLMAILLALFGLPQPSYAETIYSWKDKNGTLRFSNEPPPEGVTEYKTTVSEAGDNNPQSDKNQRRSNYDEMVDKASREADASRREREERAAAEAAEKKRLAEEKRKARNLAERMRIEKQIEAIKNRAVSPTYPNGMKQAQIDALAKKLEDLDSGTTDDKKEGGDTGDKTE